jgi:hypothetical protein
MTRPALIDRLVKGSLLPPAAAAALVAAAIWMAAVVGYAAGLFGSDEAQPGGLTAVVLLIASLLPVGMLLSVAAMARETAALRAEIAALRAALGVARVEAPRDGPSPEAARAAADAARAAAAETARALASRLDRLETALRAEAGADAPASGRVAPARPAPAPRPAAAPRGADAPGPQAAAEGQADLPFREASAAPVGWAQIARALDFPRDQSDAEGFAALRAAVADPQVAQLLQAAEDVLTLLAADGLHMEDLSPRETRLEDWRAYAEGARGAKAAAIGAIEDPDIVGRVRARVKRDAIFRDACLVFARRWATLVQRLFRDLGEDPAMLALADSRSGRAFMLTARAMGAFD